MLAHDRTHSPRSEAPRDEDETAFTPTLRSVWRAHHGIICVTFVDGFGECIDYCSEIDPFETKIMGAHLGLIMTDLLRSDASLHGEVIASCMRGKTRDFFVYRVSDDYILGIVAHAGTPGHTVNRAASDAMDALRSEARLTPPAGRIRLQSDGF
jgi:hypothetical protein